MIPFFVGYALLVWYLAVKYRRLWPGAAAVAVGTAGLVGVNWIHAHLPEWTGMNLYLPVLQSIMYPYTALVLMVGCYLCVLPRVWNRGCTDCGYDLTGLPRSVDRCPECGGVINRAGAHVYRPSGFEREDLSASDAPRRVEPPRTPRVLSTSGNAIDDTDDEHEHRQSTDE